MNNRNSTVRLKAGFGLGHWLIVLAAVLAPLCRADWPMFRGNPALTGIASNSPALPDSPVRLWTHKTGGPVKSSAAVVGDRVFIGSSDQKMYCLDFGTGAKRWEFRTEGGIESTPLVLDGRVHFGSEDGWVYSLDADSGKLLWKFQTGDKILGGPNWVRAPKGDEKWVLVGSYDFKLYALSASTGKSNWVYESGNYINGTPAVANNQTVFGGCDALMHVISLTDGSKVKEFDAGAYIAGSSALSGKFAYVGHYENEFLCFDLEKGTNIWSYRDRNFPYFSSPAVTATRVVFGGRDKRLHCLNKADGTAAWVFPTRGKVDSSPVVAGSRVVVGSDDGFLYIVNLDDGREVWSYEVGQAVGSSPAVTRGRIVVGADDGQVYCFGPPNEGKP